LHSKALNGQRHRHSNERIGGVQVTTEEEPAHQGPKAASPQAPFMQLIKVCAIPACGEEAHHGHNQEKENEDSECAPLHRNSPFAEHIPSFGIDKQRCSR